VTPLLLQTAGAPIEGYRRPEQRLNRLVLDVLRKTHPRMITTESLIDTLLNNARLLRSLFAETAKRSPEIDLQRIDRMIDAIVRDLGRSS